jgi:hypothetical protein
MLNGVADWSEVNVSAIGIGVGVAPQAATMSR